MNSKTENGHVAGGNSEPDAGLQSVTRQEMIAAACGLASDDGENPEYDRALAELIARCFPVTGDTDTDAADAIEEIFQGAA